MSNYRNRPFMVVTYQYVLAEGQKTNTPGFGKTAEWEPVENMVITDKITGSQMNRAEIILDLLEGKLVKCRDGSLDEAKLFNTFVARFQGEIKSALANWIAKDSRNLERVQNFVARFEETKNAN